MELDQGEWEEARIEQIGTGRTKDLLMVSNRKPNLWIMSLFNGYKQLGTYSINKPHAFEEKENIFIRRGKVKKKFLFWHYKTIDIIAVKGDIGDLT